MRKKEKYQKVEEHVKSIDSDKTLKVVSWLKEKRNTEWK